MEPAAPGTEDEVIHLSQLNKQENEQDRLLKLKVQLRNGQYTNIFELSYQNGSEHWFCKVCECPIMGRVYQHEIGRRHTSNLEAHERRSGVVKKTSENPKQQAEEQARCLEIAPGEPIPPGFEGEVQRRAIIQDRLDGFKVGPLVALEYLIEMHTDDTQEPLYLCILCDKKGDPRTVLTHLASYNHISQYLQKHFAGCYRALAPYMTKQYKRNWQITLQKIAEAIEKKYGRLKPFCMDKDKFESDRLTYLNMINKSKHFSEHMGSSFAELVVHDELTKVYDEKGEAKPQPNSWGGKASIEKPFQKRSPSPPVVARPTKRTKPSPKLPGRKSSPQGRRRSLSSVSSQSDDEGKRGGRNNRRAVSPRRRERNYRRRSPTPPARRRPSPRNDRPRVTKDDEAKKQKEKQEKASEFHRLCKAIDNDMERIWKNNEKNPEKHQKYNDEWKKFWNRRYKEIQAEGKDPSKHDFKPEWILFWGQKMSELHQEEMKNRKDGLRRRLGLEIEDISGEKKPPPPVVMKVGKQPSSKQTPNMPMASRPDNDPEVIVIEDKKSRSERERETRGDNRGGVNRGDTQRDTRGDTQRDTRGAQRDTKRSNSPWEQENNHRPAQRRSKSRERQRSPERRRSPLKRSPEQRKRSPENKRSPMERNIERKLDWKSPERKMSPSKRRSPQRPPLRISPYKRIPSPIKRAPSPNRRMASPTRKLPSPGRLRISPARRHSPAARALRISPARNKSPERPLKISPANRRPSQERLRISPRRSPFQERILSPSRNRILSPRRNHDSRERSGSGRRSRSKDPFAADREREMFRERERGRYSRERSYERERMRRERESSYERDMRGRDRIRTVAELPWEREKMMYDRGRMPYDNFYQPPPPGMYPMGGPMGMRPPMMGPPGMGRDQPPEEEEDDGQVNIVSVLRLLTALEERLGSLGPKVIDLLAQALALEKKEANSSEMLLDNEINCVLFETVKEKLKGQLLAGLVEPIQERAYKKAIQKAANIVHIAEQRKRQRLQFQPPEKSPVVVPGVGQVDKAAIARQVANALVAQGKTDVTQAELEQLINAVVGMAEASRNSAQPVTTANFLANLASGGSNTSEHKAPEPEKEKATPSKATRLEDLGTEPLSPSTPEKSQSHNNMENLSDSDLQTLLQNFKDLSTEEQMNLINYLKKLEFDEPERVERLRKFVNLGGPTSKPEGNDESNRDTSPNLKRTDKADKSKVIHLDSEDEDYSYEDVVKTVSKNVQQKEMDQKMKVVEDSISFDTNRKDEKNLTDAKALISNLMGSINKMSQGGNVDLLGLGSNPSNNDVAKSLSNLGNINLENLGSILSNVQSLTSQLSKNNGDPIPSHQSESEKSNANRLNFEPPMRNASPERSNNPPNPNQASAQHFKDNMELGPMGGYGGRLPQPGYGPGPGFNQRMGYPRGPRAPFVGTFPQRGPRPGPTGPYARW